MKKIISVLLAVALIAAMSVTVFAHDSADNTFTSLPCTDSSDVNVKIATQTGTTVATVYHVDVTWDSLDFTYTYNKSEKNSWNPENHTFSEDGSEDTNNWDKTSAKVTVTNHSNAAVNVAAAYSANQESAAKGVTAKIDKSEVALATAVGTPVSAAPSGEFTVTISGIPNATGDFKVGTLTLTISAPAASGT